MEKPWYQKRLVKTSPLITGQKNVMFAAMVKPGNVF